MVTLPPEKRTCATIMDIIKFKMDALEKRGVVIKLLWLVVLKICFEKLATMQCPYCELLQEVNFKL